MAGRKGGIGMPHRIRAWVWTGRAVAVAAVAGLAGYLSAAGLDQAGKLAAPIGAAIALAGLFAPYLPPSISRQRLQRLQRLQPIRRRRVLAASRSSPVTAAWPRSTSARSP